MDTLVSDKPNLQPEVVPVQNVSISDDAIAAKMAAMRNQTPTTSQTETGTTAEAKAAAPVAPEGSEVLTDDDTNLVEQIGRAHV